MACGCGGASNVYKPPRAPGAQAAKAAAPSPGLPKVWNGPSPKRAAK